MAWKTETDDRSTDLEVELAKVQAVAPPLIFEDPIYKYLLRVYRLRRKVSHSSELKKAIKAEHAGHFPNRVKDYAGVIIDLTAPHVTSRAKYKYVTTIKYALKEGVEPKHFIAFVKEQGGINKCCELWAKTYGRRRPASAN
jgi:hypothetical protein